nr:glycoside hydrolase family 16 protein [Pedobacter sp. ASV19]
MKNYLQQGTILDGVKGIRPKGQVFEIDVFENLDAQFVLHGHVDEHGAFLHNLATDIAEGFTHVDQWVTHGILWTPSSIKHYINGKLIKAYDNKNQIYSPNHFMNVFLGSYGAGGQVNMEVDYIRAYNWPLENGNELPNPGFEANTTLLPWEGSGTLSAAAARKGQYGLLLKPGQSIEQYVFLNNSKDYELTYWVKGKGKLKATVDNLKQVSGDVEQSKDQTITGKSDYTEQWLKFKTGKEYGDYMKTIRVKFANTGDTDLNMDDIEIRKK